ncbi:MAG: DUF3179 domain-containing protein, partial [Acidimicrobiia bacterium]|nr:DUF3179 domain-containing protein [Acidimicrobiia bacterium]
SVWSQPIGEAILGPLTGERLELLPSALSTWADWKQSHPDTLALDVESGQDGFDLEVMAIVVELGPDSVAYPIPELRKTLVANHEVNGVPVAVVLEPGSDNWTVFSRRLDGEEVIELELTGGELREIGGTRSFDATRGLALGSGGNGQNLDPLPGFTSFPADYTTFFPQGSFWTTEGVLTVEDLLS